MIKERKTRLKHRGKQKIFYIKNCLSDGTGLIL